MVKWRGVKKAKGKLGKMKSSADSNLDESLNLFSQYGEQKVKESAVFVKGYSTGHLRRSIRSGKKDRGYNIISPAEYSGWLEHGTRKMSAQPFFHQPIRSAVENDLGKFLMRR